MSRGLKTFVIATACVTTLIVMGAPLLRLATNASQKRATVDEFRLAVGREFFDQYVRLEHDRDEELLNLYSDEAIIIDRRPSPNGKMNDLNIPMAAFRPMLKGMLVVAKASGDPPMIYTGTKILLDNDGVRIETDCYSESDEFQRHLSMFIRPIEEDTWRIEELIVESPEVRR